MEQYSVNRSVLMHKGKELMRDDDAQEPPIPGAMTLAELRRIVVVLSNSCFVRYWVDFRTTKQRQTLMALCAIEAGGRPAKLYEHDLEREGFVKEVHDGLDFRVVRRVDEQGNPWLSRLL